jgi:hypothetical protein
MKITPQQSPNVITNQTQQPSLLVLTTLQGTHASFLAKKISDLLCHGDCIRIWRI